MPSPPPRPPSWLLAAALLALATSTAAQETIFDPENPRAGEAPEAEPEPAASAAEAASSLEPGLFSGGYLGRLFVDTGRESTFEDVFLLQNRLDLRLRLPFGARWLAVIEGRLEHRLWAEGNPDGRDWLVNGENYQGVVEADLRDAFVSGRLGRDGRAILTIGNQAIVWGAGTLSQPAAVINPIDYRTGVFDTPADQRIPVLAGVLEVIVDRLTLTAVLVPFFEPHRVDVLGTDFSIERALISALGVSAGLGLPRPDDSLEPLLQEALLVTVYPEATPENVSAGARVTSTYGGVDLGLGYFFGWDRVPFAQVDLSELVAGLAGDAPLGSVDSVVSSRYERLHVVELDAVTYLGELGVRLETVYQLERTVYVLPAEPPALELALPRAVRLPTLTTALALSWEESSHLVVQVEGLWTHTFDLPPGDELALGDESTWAALFAVLFELERIEALAGTFVGDLALRFSGLVGLDEGDAALYPSLVWAVTEVVDLSLGAQLFVGPSPREVLTLGGLLDDNDQVFVSAEVGF